MSKKYKFNDPEGYNFITNTVIHWIDIFTRVEYCSTVVNCMNHSIQNNGLCVHAWVIMPSHFHAIVSTTNLPLEKCMQGIKSYSSRQIIKEINQINESRSEWLLNAFHKAAVKNKRGSNYIVWQDGSHPLELTSNREIEQRIDYIHQNPVVAGYVEEPEHWVYSSARDYSGFKGLIEIELLN